MKKFMEVAVRMVCIFMIVLAGYSYADDVVGVMRVDVNTNGFAEVEMPFEPMENITPSGFMAGVFLGDGSVLSDRLFCRMADSGILSNAVWNGADWFDSATSYPSPISIRPGDTLYFLRADEEPFSFSLFGRHPSFLHSQELPRFSSLRINPTNDTVSLLLQSENHLYDLFSFDTTNISLAASHPWIHISRQYSPLSATELTDSLPEIGYSRLYSVSDAFLDTDIDRLSDALETLVYKTNPYCDSSNKYCSQGHSPLALCFPQPDDSSGLEETGHLVSE